MNAGGFTPSETEAGGEAELRVHVLHSETEAGREPSLWSSVRGETNAERRYPAPQYRTPMERARSLAMERARSEFFRAEMGGWTRRWTYDTAVERERQWGRSGFSRFQMGRRGRREEAAARREIARRLVLIKEGGISWRLGYSKLSDYVLESLGISPRSAQELMRTERALAGLPLAERAYDRGEIGSEHLRLLTRAVKKDNEAEWVDAAKDLTVQGLALRFASRGVGTDLYEGGVASFDAERTQPREFDAPAYIKTFWRERVSFARTLAALKLTEGECLEDVLAELANVAPLREIRADDDEMLSPSAFAPGTTREEQYRICVTVARPRWALI